MTNAPKNEQANLRAVDPLAAILALHRRDGDFGSGDVTPKILQELFAKYASSIGNGRTLGPSYLSKALDYFRDEETIETTINGRCFLSSS